MNIFISYIGPHGLTQPCFQIPVAHGVSTVQFVHFLDKTECDFGNVKVKVNEPGPCLPEIMRKLFGNNK